MDNYRSREELPKEWKKVGKSIQGWEVFQDSGNSYRAVQFGSGSPMRRDEILRVSSQVFDSKEAVANFLPGRQVTWFN